MARTDVENNVLSAITKAVKECDPIEPVPNVKNGKRARIVVFQEYLRDVLKDKGFTDYDCEKLIFKDGLSGTVYADIQDRADVYAKKDDYEIIIEIDATRADQVAKKMVSRLSYHLLTGKEHPGLIYVALLYPGTGNMNADECIKYFIFGQTIISQFQDSSFIGCLIDNTTKTVTDYRKSTMPSMSPLQIEQLEIDAYASHLRDNYTPNSVYCYLGALSIVRDALVNGKYNTIEECVKDCIESIEAKSNKTKTDSNNLTYLRTYLKWRT